MGRDFLEERLEARLGECRAKFIYGDLSEENLGPMFGGYGTFLAVDERSPSPSPSEQPRNHSSREPRAPARRKPKCGERMEERLEAVLGECRAAFMDGDISQENLGPMFGSYGTFLPVYHSEHRLCRGRVWAVTPNHSSRDTLAMDIMNAEVSPARPKPMAPHQRRSPSTGRIARAPNNLHCNKEEASFKRKALIGNSSSSSSYYNSRRRDARHVTSSSIRETPQRSHERKVTGSASCSSYRRHSLTKSSYMRRHPDHATSYSIRGH